MGAWGRSGVFGAQPPAVRRLDHLVFGLAMVGVAFGLPARGRAQGAADSFTESVTLETAAAVEKKFATVRDYIARKQWPQAVEVLRQTMRDDGDALFHMSPGHYVNVRRYCQFLLCGLSRPGLAVYRRQVDAEARILFEAGRKRADDASLRKLLRDFFASSSGDDALFLLAERAWHRGDIGQARRYWEQSLPLSPPPAPGEPLPVLRYPDSPRPPAETLARLVMCSLAEGDLSRAGQELAAFRKMNPNAVGVLGGRRGKLADLLATTAKQAQQWRSVTTEDTVPTFALNAQRNRVLSEAVDVAPEGWSVVLPVRKARVQRFGPVPLVPEPLSFHPVVFDDVALVNNTTQIRAWNVRTGKPAWPVVDGDNAVIYPPVPEESGNRSIGPTVGVPHFSMTIDDGRLYAKMGSSITARSGRDRFGDLPSDLVCLDLARGQGKLVWKVSASGTQPGWAFEGSPVVAAGRVFVVLRRRNPSTQLNVACYDAETGQPLWNQKVCASLDAVSEAYNVISHLLLTVGGDALYLSTNFGAVASLDRFDGTLRWVTTYPRETPRPLAALNDPRRQSLKPCLYHQGTLVVAPNDSAGLFALDAETGAMRWQSEPRGGLRHLLGVAGANLIASGKRLWAFDLYSGRVVWQIGFEDPIGHGAGRGVLAGRFVYWPTRAALFVLDQQTGDVRRRIPWRMSPRQTGGNLTVTHGLLLVAGPNRLTAFGPPAAPHPRPKLPFPFNLAQWTLDR